MYEGRFAALYAGLAVLALAAACAGLYKIAMQDTRTVVKTVPAKPITTLEQAKSRIKGDAVTDAQLPDGCVGVYVKGGAVILCAG